MNDYKRTLVQWWPPLLLSMLCITAQALGLVETLRFERTLINHEPWRLLSGHLVHLGWGHLALNLAGLALIWALFGRLLYPWAWGLALLLSGAAIGIALYLRDSGLAWYVGLSGVLHSLLVLGALASLRREPRTALLLLVMVAAKIAWEQFTGSSAGTGDWVGGPVIVNAHLYGALAGVACVPLLRLGRRASPA